MELTIFEIRKIAAISNMMIGPVEKSRVYDKKRPPTVETKVMREEAIMIERIRLKNMLAVAEGIVRIAIMRTMPTRRIVATIVSAMSE